MINIFFVPGMFGSTIEYILSSYSKELVPIQATVLKDGSMHSYRKEAHIFNLETLESFLSNTGPTGITTPIYPFKTRKLPEILYYFSENGCLEDAASMLIYADNLPAAELNMLFQYHKIAIGLGMGLDIFCNGNEHNITAWNPDYTHWSQMQPWQLREWISLFYQPWVQEWINSIDQVDTNFLTIKNTDFLFDTVNAANKIFNYCGLTTKTGLDDFLDDWRQYQQYIVDEFNLLDRIIFCTLHTQPFQWQPINIIAEAIIQQRLRTLGYEIRCDGLDIFPTDAIMFNTLLEKVNQ
jgi:hypothetical protein